MREDERQALRALIAEVMPGRESALVFGEGPQNPALMLIGEAPGEQESLLGRPFVGKAGQNLDRFLALAQLAREQIYISNAVKIRPTKVGKTGRIGNRPPTGAEIALFRPWLLREIEWVRPRLIATLGNVPLRALMGGEWSVGQAHGRMMAQRETGLPLFALYHPASLIYNRSLEAVYEADVRALAKAVRTALSDGKTDI